MIRSDLSMMSTGYEDGRQIYKADLSGASGEQVGRALPRGVN